MLTPLNGAPAQTQSWRRPQAQTLPSNKRRAVR